MKKEILLTGDRPTGKLHLGHYVGSIKNRIKFQEKYECFFILADLHTLTTKNSPQNIAELPLFIKDMVIDYLSCGIDPNLSTIYLQSAIKEVSELHLLFSMLVSVPRLQRIPSLKDMANHSDMKEMNLGLLSYPVLQTADILLSQASVVPVGKDNESHIELTREIARKFNYLYQCALFPEPKTILGEVSSLVGTDGKAAKMSKSLNNAIFLSDEDKVLRKKIMGMFTDPNRISAETPGETYNNPVFVYHRTFNSNKKEVNELTELYEKGKVGDVIVKERLYEALKNFLSPIQERRREILSSDKNLVEEIIFEGTLKFQEKAKRLLKEVKKVMGLSKIWNGISRKVEKNILNKTKDSFQ